MNASLKKLLTNIDSLIVMMYKISIKYNNGNIFLIK